VSENKRRKSDPPDIFQTTADGPQQTQEGYRIVWCRSSQKAEIDAQLREAALQKTETELFSLNARLNRGKLRKRASINPEIKKALRKYDGRRFLMVRIVSQIRIQTKRLRPGRPGKNNPVKEVRTRIYRLEVRRDKKALWGEARTDGVFPLVSNMEPRQASKKEILLIYKYQPYVERRHALFKSELEVAPVYIKKPHRAAGLVHAGFLAMTLDALIERSLRRGMQREGIETLPILPEGRPTKTPTTARLLEMFSDVAWYEFQRGGETVTFPIKLSPLQRQLLRLLDMDPPAYA
jgi:transposase